MSDLFDSVILPTMYYDYLRRSENDRRENYKEEEEQRRRKNKPISYHEIMKRKESNGCRSFSKDHYSYEYCSFEKVF